MDDLISRRAAIDEIKAVYEWHDTVTVDRLIQHFKALPPVDAVPVVRCKDCKYWDTFPSSSLAPEFHKCKGLGVHTVADFFCSKGERTNE